MLSVGEKYLEFVVTRHTTSEKGNKILGYNSFTAHARVIDGDTSLLLCMR